MMMILDSTKTAEEHLIDLQAIITALQAERAELQAELDRTVTREIRLQDENDKLWEVVRRLYEQSMPHRRGWAKRILPSLKELDVNHTADTNR